MGIEKWVAKIESSGFSVAILTTIARDALSLVAWVCVCGFLGNVSLVCY